MRHLHVHVTALHLRTITDMIHLIFLNSEISDYSRLTYAHTSSGATLKPRNRNPESGTKNRNPETGNHKSKKKSSSNTQKLFAELLPVKIKRPSKKVLKLNHFSNKNSPSVEIRTTVISSEGYDSESLNKVRRNMIPSTLRASKISLLVINRAAMGRAWFMFYPWLIFFFGSDQTQTFSRPNFKSCNL